MTRSSLTRDPDDWFGTVGMVDNRNRIEILTPRQFSERHGIGDR